MTERRAGLIRRAVIWTIVLGILGGAALLWGDDLLYYATGQKIIDDLHADLAASTIPVPAPTESAATPEPPPVQAPSEPEAAAPTIEAFPDEPRPHVTKYRVQAGEGLVDIAARFELNPSTILWANSDQLHDNVNALRAGMELYILPVDGVYHSADGLETIANIASLYNVTAQVILSSEYNTMLNGFTASDVPAEGLHIVVPGGRRDITSYRSPMLAEPEGSGPPDELAHPGACQPVSAPEEAHTNFIMPLATQPHSITTEFETWHPAIDIGAEETSYVYSSEAGVVIFAGWHQDGYGEMVAIDHGGGWVTYYAHLDRSIVRCGQTITKAQLLGYVGMTGNATTPHLHFEMRLNDIPQNPRPGACHQNTVYNGIPDDFINPLGDTPYLVTAEFVHLWHAGVDFAASRGTPIYAIEDGLVIFAGNNLLGYGGTVVIDHGDSISSYYAHLDALFVNCGDVVNAGDPVGEMGMSGNATGVHLHFELHVGDTAVDPRLYFDIRDRTESF